MMRGRRYFRSQDKTLFDINRSMLLQSKVADIILNRPVRFQIAGEFQWFSVLIDFAFRSFAFSFFFLKFFIAERMRSRLDQTGIDGYAFVDG